MTVTAKMTALCMLLTSGLFAQASVVTEPLTIKSETTDTSVYANNAGFNRTDASTIYIGRTSSSAQPECAVLIFSLQSIPMGMEVVSATIYFQALKSSSPTPTFNVDVYGIGLRDSNVVQTSDYNTAGTLIQNDALTKTGNYNAGQMYTISGQSLVDYINSQLFSVISNGYLFLRFSADSTPGAGEMYQIGSGGLGRGWTYLELTLGSAQIPEPTTIMLLGAGAALLMMLRRRNKKYS